jgi:hypothetical protein
MSNRMRSLSAVLIGGAIVAGLVFAACGDDDDDGGGATATAPVASATHAASTPAASPTAAASPVAATDPCTLRTSLEGQPLTPGQSFALGSNRWQVCAGGAAAGSSEKLLFHSSDGGANWTLISRTTLGNPPAEAGVGEMPNQGSVSVILFLDANNGWLGLQSPGVNLHHSTDGGVSWTAINDVPPAVPVTAITFTDAMHGTVTTSDSTWTTSDGGATWTETP